jgi:phosphonate transport system substrate-binding protein
MAARGRGGYRRAGWCLCLIAAALPVLAADPSPAGNGDIAFRLGFTSSMFTQVNEGDARAAMKVWIQTVARERKLPVDPQPVVHSTVEALLAASRTNRVDGFGVTTDEYARLAGEVQCDRLAVSLSGGKATDSYVLLVHADGDIKEPRDLENRSLLVLRNPRMSLAMTWLETLLMEQGVKEPRKLFSRIGYSNKGTQVALPVFFRQMDACLMTRRGLSVMAELNPQLGRQLRVLAASPEYVPSCFAFRADFGSPHRELILSEMGRLSETPAGRQILTLTQADRINEFPVSVLDGALELLAQHERLRGADGSRQTAFNYPLVSGNGNDGEATK